MRKIRVVIDPGHGGEDRWNRGPTSYIEADGMLKVSKYLQEKLQKSGHFEVKLTREKDQTLSRKQRAEIARDFKADLFISEHTNAFNGTAKGTEVYYSVERKRDLSLANKMSRAIATNFNTNNRGAKIRLTTKRDDYYGILYYGVLYHIPSIILIESLFHDHIEEEKILLEDHHLRDLAEVQCEVIKDYYGINEEESRNKEAKEKNEVEPYEKLYRVQVGAFQQKENALQMIEALENDGYPTYLVSPK